jgi:excisionase family DNA binding protein
MAEEWITTKEAADLIGVTDAHVRYLLGKGRIQGKKFAGVWMVSRQAVVAYKNKVKRLGKKKHGLRFEDDT